LAKRIIHVGPAGWSYKDWEGIVYPQKPGKSFDPLEYLTQFFNTIEINSSFLPAAGAFDHEVVGQACGGEQGVCVYGEVAPYFHARTRQSHEEE